MAVEVCQACRVHLPHTWNGFIQSTPAVIGTFQEASRVNYPNDKNYANSSMSSSFCLFSSFGLLGWFVFTWSSEMIRLGQSEGIFQLIVAAWMIGQVVYYSFKTDDALGREKSGIPEFGEMSGFRSLTRCSRMHSVRGDTHQTLCLLQPGRRSNRLCMGAEGGGGQTAPCRGGCGALTRWPPGDSSAEWAGEWAWAGLALRVGCHGNTCSVPARSFIYHSGGWLMVAFW